MRNHSAVIFILLAVLLSLFDTACKNFNSNIPFPATNNEFAQPQTKPFSPGNPEAINWIAANADSIAPVVTYKFDHNSLPVKHFDVGSPEPLKAPLDESVLNWNSLGEKPFDLKKLPTQPLKFKTFLLKKPQIIKGGPPHVREGASRGIMEFGIDQAITGKSLNCLQDAYGMMWLATDKGLCRYDGNQYEFYATKDNAATHLFEDDQHRIWMGMRSGTVFVVDQKAGIFKTLIQDATESNGIFGFMQDQDGQIWFTKNGKGVYIINLKDQTIKEFGVEQGLSTIYPVRIMQDKGKLVWITDGGQKSTTIIDTKLGKIRYLKNGNGLTDSGSISTFQDAQDRIWISGGGGIDIVDLKKNTIKRLGAKQGFAFSHALFEVIQDRYGNYWIGTDTGTVYKYNEPSGLIEKFTVSLAPDDPVLDIKEDKNGIIWICTPQAGGTFLNPANGNTGNYTKANGIADDNVWALLEDSTGNIWLGTYDGINIYTPALKTLKHISRVNGIAKRVTAMAFDKKGRVFATGGSAGINVIDIKNSTVSYINKDQGLSTNDGASLLTDKDGVTWMGANDGTVQVIDIEKKTIKKLAPRPELTNNAVTTLRQDTKGQVWIGIINGGVDIIDAAQKTIRHLSTANGLSGNRVFTLREDNDGRMWIGSDKGIDIADLEKGTITTITPKEGLAAAEVFTLTKKDDQIYAGTTRGLSIINIPPKQDTLFKWNITSYGRPQGFTFLDFAENADLLTKKGQFWWGVEGQVLTVMNSLPADTSVVPVYITGISVMDKPTHFRDVETDQNLVNADTVWNTEADTFYTGGKLPVDPAYAQKGDITWSGTSGPYNLPEKLKLPNHQNYLSFRFNSVNFSNTDKIRYRYILQGIDKKWSDITANNFSENYRDLPFGYYVFQVSAKGANGIWSPPAQFAFAITPPWWRTWWAYLIYAIAGAALISVYVRYRSRKLKEENQRLEEKISLRTNELQKSIQELRDTQTQLIQSEKMASLGELTAGIAHEIQNPLNFVNNFAEINSDIIDDMNAELLAGNTKEAIALATSIKENNEKITHHGRRADSIVKGMLQHSRKSTGIKEPTDINALVDECMRLSYHGLRAKDKSFNALFKTSLDDSITKINVVPQDIGRVLLNLFNNAFYAVAEKKLALNGTFEPLVTVSTLKQAHSILITVKDNGNGIPPTVLEKIYQPFYTTKPAGKGTGLGLSMSYDIITKGHNGKLTADTKEGEYAAFIIELPMT
jgi:signal transduction histidine kinase/ligand-binding sensor domain-containing protein